MINEERVPVVGLGASAGGIEAFRAFFAAMPPDSGLAFVVVLHLSPERSSMLPAILGNWTSMPVLQATEGCEVVADHVYVIPPSVALTLCKGHLRLKLPSGPRHASTTVDVLFASLAADLGEDAIGVVLSGTGTDGSLGLKAIKACGGVTLAQGVEGKEPEYPGMPAAAIATGAVDLVLAVEDMPARILDIVQARREARRRGKDDAPGERAADVRLEICGILQEQVDHDFSLYKEATFLRRVERRLQVVGLGPAAYVERLRVDKGEVVLLFRDLLVGVTSFFRDTATFEAVEAVVMPRLFEGKGARDQIRVWVPGCATGEEAYSLAIMLIEHMAKLGERPKVKIFATDIDDPAIAIARVGRYPSVLLRDVPPARVARFFTKLDDGYVVAKEVRDLCTFSTHSVIRDPPFSRMNLISCRNLLIYLGPELQSHVIPAFHYSLEPKGLLLLGGSESATRHADLFALLDRKHRIFERRDAPSPPLQVSTISAPRRPAWIAPHQGEESPGDHSKAIQFASRRVRDRFSPAFAVVTAEGEAVHFSPRTGKYLEIAPGAPGANVLSQARPGLRLELRTALRKAAESGGSVQREHVNVQFDGGVQAIVLTVEPVPDQDGEPLFMVVFSDDERAGPPPHGDEGLRPELTHYDSTIEQMEHELRDAREQNQSVREEYETAIEEIKSSNEELHSVNEELQSSNEELETSKEEIQSVNEELHTVNNQLTSKVDELDRSSNDLKNLFESTRVATLFLDRNLLVRSFTPAVAGIYNLIPSDQGRPLTDIASSLDYDGLRADVRQVLATLDLIERRVRRRDTDAHYLMRVLPYRAADNQVEGVLITFIDVTSIVLAEQHHRLLVDELNHRVKNMLTVVISLASQTLRRAHSLEGFSDAFMGRLRALGAAYTLLSRDQWTDIPLQDVLAEELSPYINKAASNITFAGPPIYLRPKGAMAFGMVVHELATNAVKYGALSLPEGRVAVTWSVAGPPDAEELKWSWVERDGPLVELPTARGFGVSLIERSLSHEMNGSAKVDFLPGGLEARLAIPLDPMIAGRTTLNPGFA